MKAPIYWLLKGDRWIEYRTRLDFLGQSVDDSRIRSVRASMLANPQV